MKKQYIMGLLFGLSLGVSTQSYGMLEEDWEMVEEHEAIQPLVNFFAAYDAANDKKSFLTSDQNTWVESYETIGKFVLNNSKNNIGVTDQNLIKALKNFLHVIAWYYPNVLAPLHPSYFKKSEILGIEYKLSLLDNTVNSYLVKKHITKNKEAARLVLRKAIAILKGRILTYLDSVKE